MGGVLGKEIFTEFNSNFRENYYHECKSYLRNRISYRYSPVEDEGFLEDSGENGKRSHY